MEFSHQQLGKWAKWPPAGEAGESWNTENSTGNIAKQGNGGEASGFQNEPGGGKTATICGLVRGGSENTGIGREVVTSGQHR